MGHNLVLPRRLLLGRAETLVQVRRLLLQEDVGLLTLTGPGGIGKTRLALQAAANVLDHFADGVYFVALAAVVDPAIVLSTIAQVLRVREDPGQPVVATSRAPLHVYDEHAFPVPPWDCRIPPHSQTGPGASPTCAVMPDAGDTGRIGAGGRPRRTGCGGGLYSIKCSLVAHMLISSVHWTF